ncbi:hypothetical protein CPAR01_07482 [Colletotrichum paranaense]|uniref:Uncharacterized protein n=1 Tax=Colletotrichum paranaense TaxID=1914294 RepID=A0ABQ9SPW7_9PEZI|nr:uncharacterized protein CPAR01_07482 [Colletotrichum paranaense]KAK1541493.1 hypothetical protein CPAR01_07482 [Colletotrichum paranaense]
MDDFDDRGNRASLHEQLAFFALTNEIDYWNSQCPQLATQLLNDNDQHVISACYKAHLMPTARSFWWNGENANIATSILLSEMYPLLENNYWKRSRLKATDILRTWRQDAARLLPFDDVDNEELGNTRVEEEEEEIEEDSVEEDRDVRSLSRSLQQCGMNDQHDTEEDTEDVIFVAERPAPSKKRKVESPLSPVITPKRAKHHQSVDKSVYDFESSDDDIIVRRRRPLAKSAGLPRIWPAGTLITPPQSDGSSPTVLIDSYSDDQEPLSISRRRDRLVTSTDSDSDDQEPLSMGRRRGRRLFERKESPKPSMERQSQLGLSPIRTVATTEPVEAPKEKHNCVAALEDLFDSVNRFRDQFTGEEWEQADRQLKEMGKRMKRMSKMAKTKRMDRSP